VKLLVPYVGLLESEDARLIDLAEFLGICCETVPLGGAAPQDHAGALESQTGRDFCLVLNPKVIAKWIGSAIPFRPTPLPWCRFPFLLLHAPRPDAFDASLITQLSGGWLRGVRAVEALGSYVVAADSRDVCGPFAGVDFGPVNPANDQVFQYGSALLEGRSLISVGGDPFMAALTRNLSEILFLGGAGIANLNDEVGERPTGEFSRFLPYAMALRYIFGEQSWRPGPGHGCVIVDDPLLRSTYGFLNFKSLLGMTKESNFHATIAFIPHNYRRSAPAIIRLFHENPARLSLCVHGNDHTGAELATVDPALLHSMLQIAESRIATHEQKTGLACQRVMVFPQGNFSREAMSVLQARNFDCAVNTKPYSRDSATARLTLGEVAQPALLRYSGFPLFLRVRSSDVTRQDVAFNLFFGRPIFLVEHHNAFKNPAPLLDAVSTINSVDSAMCWTNVGEASANSLWRRRSNHSEHLRAYCRTVRIANDSDGPARFCFEWRRPTGGGAIEAVLLDGESSGSFDLNGQGVSVAIEMAPRTSRTVSLVYPQVPMELPSLGARRKIRAFVRRRLSEIRDNYLSRNELTLTVAQKLRRALLG
jgi:hypothetical protein